MSLNIGDIFGRLTIAAPAEKKHRSRRWVCNCSCGNQSTVYECCLKSGATRSCGCYQKELVSAALKKQATTHGMSYSSEYSIWEGMIRRCCKPGSPRYEDYGGRGITVCPEWFSFENFYRDMGDRPSKDHTLDRKDNDGSYCKENCRWATRFEQDMNKTVTVRLTYNEETLTLFEWSDRTGLSVAVLRTRKAREWPVEDILTTPIGERRKR